MTPFQAMRLRQTVAPIVYSTWSPTDKGAGVTLSGGNLVATCGSTDSVRGTRSHASGKRYFEVTVSGGAFWGIGVALSTANLTQYPGFASDSWGYFYNGQKAVSSTFTSYGAAMTSGDVIGVGYDHATGNLEFFKNGVSQGLIATSGFAGNNVFPVMGSASASSCVGTINVGATAFAFGLPSGYTAWT